MSGIAEVLLALGYAVSGSDMKASSTTERLRGLGCKIFDGHEAEHVRGAQVLVVSSAIRPDNPESPSPGRTGKQRPRLSSPPCLPPRDSTPHSSSVAS